MEQRIVSKHVRNDCGYTELYCPFESLGCSTKMRRQYIKEHKSEARDLHIDLALETLSHREIYHRSLLEGEALVFQLPGYACKREKSEKFFTRPFYSHLNGYKIVIRVDTNGDGAGKGTHLSIFTKLQHGRNDSQLQWPFRGMVKYELLNQLADEKHFSRLSAFDASCEMEINSLWGYPKFFPHSLLAYDAANSTQFLLNDNLYFRVTVQVDCRLWLVNQEKVITKSFKRNESGIALKCGEAMVFKVPHYDHKKSTNEHFYSDKFYTSPEGYRMCIEVDVNGDGAGKDSHVSVYAKLLEGDNDSRLPWPFMGTVTFSLLNQISDANHHSWTLEYKATDNALAGSSWGKPRFISHANLLYDKVRETEYLKNDVLYFRVKIEASDIKQWLICTNRS